MSVLVKGMKMPNSCAVWVNADNDRAIHVYEKCGFHKTKPTMYMMEREVNDEV